MKTVHVIYRYNLGYNEEVKPIVATFYSDKDQKIRSSIFYYLFTEKLEEKVNHVAI